MNVLSLFDGISCGRVALERANITVKNYYASEIDKYATQVSQNNYPDIIRLGDINNWESWDIDWSSIDLILAGSPCQGFSFAGKQLAFDDKRSALFFRFAEILSHIQSINPNVKFLLENVRMKKDYEKIITKLLNVEPIMINSALVSAQNRKRLYWTNWHFEQPKDKGILLKDIIHETVDITIHEQLPKFNCNPSGKGINGNVTPITASKNPTITTNKGEGNKIAVPFKMIVGIKQKPRGKNSGCIHNDKSPTLTSNSFEHNNHVIFAVDREKSNCITSSIGRTTDREYFYKNQGQLIFCLKPFVVPFDKTLQILDKEVIKGKIGFFKKDNQSSRVYSIHGKAITLCGEGGGGAAKMGQYLFGCITPNRTEKRQNGQLFNEGIKFYTLTATENHGILIDGYIRKLTPIECERLQTLPDNYTQGISNSQRYKCLGNGWTVDVIAHILKSLKVKLQEHKQMDKYSIIYADPPWGFRNKASRAAATDHYPTMSIDELKALPVNEITADNAVLFMWFTGPMIKEATEVIKAWGFKLKTTKGFTWIKLNKRYQEILAKSLLVDKLSIDEALQKASFFGLGNYTRANSEDCLIAIKGKGLERISKAVSQVVYAPIGDHSEKPEEVRKRIEVLYGDLPRVELFARENPTGWHCWGNECVNDIELTS